MRIFLTIASSILAVTVSGCAGGAADIAQPATDTEATAPAASGDSDGNGDGASIGTFTVGEIVYDVVNGVVDSFVSYEGSTGTDYSTLGAATFLATGTTVSGSSAIVDETGAETLMTQFRFDVPSERQEC